MIVHTEYDCTPWQTREGCSQAVSSNHAQYLGSLQVRAMHNDTHPPARDFACDFTVKFSSSACVVIVASLTGEMAARSFVYHGHGTADSDKSCCYPWFVCHYKTLNLQYMLAHAGLLPPPPMINHQLVYVFGPREGRTLDFGLDTWTIS